MVMGNSHEAFESEREGELRKALSLLETQFQETKINPQVYSDLSCFSPRLDQLPTFYPL